MANSSPSPTQYHDTSVDNLVVPNVFKLSPSTKNDDPKFINQNTDFKSSDSISADNQKSVQNDPKKRESKFKESANINNNNPLNSPLNVNNLLNSSANPANLSIFNSPYFNRFASPTRANPNNNLPYTFLPSTLRKNSNLIANTSMDIHFTPSVNRILKLEASQAQNAAINSISATKSQNFSTLNSTPLPKQRLSKVKDTNPSIQVGQSTPKSNSNINSLEQDKSLISQPFFTNGIFLNTETGGNLTSNGNIHGSPNLDLIKTPPPANNRSQNNSNAILPMSISKDPEYFLLNMNSILRNSSSAISSLIDSSVNKAPSSIQQTLLNIKDCKGAGESLDDSASPRSNVKAINNKSNTVSSLYPELFTGNESFSLEFQKYMTTSANTIATSSTGINLSTSINNGHSIKASTAQDLLRITPYKPIDGSRASLLGTKTIERIKKEIIDSTADDIGKIHGDDMEGDSAVCGKHDAPCFDSPTRIKNGRNHYHGNHLHSGNRRLCGIENDPDKNSNLHSLQLQASRTGKSSNSDNSSKSNQNYDMHKLQNMMTPSSMNLRSHRINSDDFDVALMESTPSKYASISFVERIRTYCEHQGLNHSGSIGSNIDEDDLVNRVDNDNIIDTNAILVESTPAQRSSSFSQNDCVNSIQKAKNQSEKQILVDLNADENNFAKHSVSIAKTTKAYKKRGSSKSSDFSTKVNQSVIDITFKSDDDKDTEYEDDGDDDDDEIKDFINSDSLTGSTQNMQAVTSQAMSNPLQYSFTNFQNSYPTHPQKHHYSATGSSNHGTSASTLTIVPHHMNIQKSQHQAPTNNKSCSSVLYSNSVTGCYDDDAQTDDPDGTLSLPSSPLQMEDSASSISNVSHNNSSMSTGAVRYNSTACSSIIEDHSTNSKDISNTNQEKQKVHSKGHTQFNQSELSHTNITTNSSDSDTFSYSHGNHKSNISQSFLSNLSVAHNSSVLHPAIGTFQTKKLNDDISKGKMGNSFTSSVNLPANSKQASFYNDNIQSMNQMVKNYSSSRKKSKRKRGSELSVIYSKYMSNPQDVNETDVTSNKRLKIKGNKKIQAKSKSFNDAGTAGQIKSMGNKRNFVVARNLDDKENVSQLKGVNNGRKNPANIISNANTSPLKDITVNVSNMHGNDRISKNIAQRSNTHPSYISNSGSS